MREIEDKKENILIVPEVTRGIKVLSNYPQMRKVIWWLSVDNFYISAILQSKKNFFFQRAVNKLFRPILRREIFSVKDEILKKINHCHLIDLLNKIIPVNVIDFHLAQSYYAIYLLKRNGIPENKVFYLSDYLNEKFLKTKTDLSKKENIVVYNPKKGFSFTKKIIKYTPDIKFVPLINMTREQVIETLQKAKVYIDFGNHPGKDRLPREAAILGCCVITGKRESAAYFEDVPIPEKYKFEDKEENVPKTVERIKDCFDNYKKRIKDFEHYRNIIQNEPKKFIEDLKDIFRVNQ